MPGVAGGGGKKPACSDGEAAISPLEKANPQHKSLGEEKPKHVRGKAPLGGKKS